VRGKRERGGDTVAGDNSRGKEGLEEGWIGTERNGVQTGGQVRGQQEWEGESKREPKWAALSRID
jgi:hypothetical protein